MTMFFTEWMQYGFMRSAFAAVLLITPLFGMLGTMIVERKMAFFSDALGHSALTGIAVGVVLGVSDTNVSMLLFAIVFALLLNMLAGRGMAANDTVISVFSSFSIAVGLAILSKGGNFSQYSSLLVGDILSISKKELFYLAVILAVTLVFWAACFNSLSAVSIHRTLAKSRRIPAAFMENLFAVLTALIVTVSIKWVGILIINALLILPAAASRNISQNLREYHFFSVLFSMFSGIFGLLVSYFINAATGPVIVIFASVIYFITYSYGSRIQ